MQNAQASVSNTRAALEKAHADVKTQEANIAAARAALTTAKLNLGYTKVLAPITGVAGFRVANIGDFVGPNDPSPLTTMSQVDPIYAEVPISEQRALDAFRQRQADAAGAPGHGTRARLTGRQRLPAARTRRSHSIDR